MGGVSVGSGVLSARAASSAVPPVPPVPPVPAVPPVPPGPPCRAPLAGRSSGAVGSRRPSPPGAGSSRGSVGSAVLSGGAARSVRAAGAVGLLSCPAVPPCRLFRSLRSCRRCRLVRRYLPCPRSFRLPSFSGRATGADAAVLPLRCRRFRRCRRPQRFPRFRRLPRPGGARRCRRSSKSRWHRRSRRCCSANEPPLPDAPLLPDNTSRCVLPLAPDVPPFRGRRGVDAPSSSPEQPKPIAVAAVKRAQHGTQIGLSFVIGFCSSREFDSPWCVCTP